MQIKWKSILRLHLPVLLIAAGAGLHMALVRKCHHAGLYRDVNGAVFASFLDAIAALGTEPKKAPYAITGVLRCGSRRMWWLDEDYDSCRKQDSQDEQN